MTSLGGCKGCVMLDCWHGPTPQCWMSGDQGLLQLQVGNVAEPCQFDISGDLQLSLNLMDFDGFASVDAQFPNPINI